MVSGLSMCARGKETPIFLVLASLLVSRTSTGDGCVFFLSHEPPTQRTSKLKKKNKKGVDSGARVLPF